MAGALSRRSTKEGANAVALALTVLAIAFLVNYIAQRQARQWDFTAARQYSLSDQTLRVLDGLTEDVSLVLLDRRGTDSEIRASDVLKLYADASPRGARRRRRSRERAGARRRLYEPLGASGARQWS